MCGSRPMQQITVVVERKPTLANLPATHAAGILDEFANLPRCNTSSASSWASSSAALQRASEVSPRPTSWLAITVWRTCFCVYHSSVQHVRLKHVALVQLGHVKPVFDVCKATQACPVLPLPLS